MRLPILNDHRELIGHVTKIIKDEIGVKVEFILYKNVQATHLSFGFRALNYKIQNGIRYISQCNIFEVSVTNFPVNPKALISKKY